MLRHYVLIYTQLFNMTNKHLFPSTYGLGIAYCAQYINTHLLSFTSNSILSYISS